MMTPLSEMGKFKTVVIDPPWPLKPIGLTRVALAPELPYKLMSVKDIGDFPVAAILDDDAIVFCWAVNRYLHDAFHLLETWGVRYSFTMAWVKGGGIKPPSCPVFNAEYVVVGKKGSPLFKDTTAFSAANFWPRGSHSEKPEEFYDLLRRTTLSPRIDIFNRRPIPGFVGWGNESPSDCELPAEYQAILV